MLEDLQALWTRQSIVEAKIQQERSRLQVDRVRLTLLEQMKSALEADIRTVESKAIRPEMGAGTMASAQQPLCAP